MPMQDRKISVSYVSEAMPTSGNEGLKNSLDPEMKDLNSRILRVQVLQVVLSITLSVLSAVALIEERSLFGLGFAIISSLASLLSAVLGMQNFNLKFSALINGVALLTLLPALYFTILRLGEFFLYEHTHHTHGNSSAADDDHTTVWILCWLQLLHIVPIGASLCYNLVLFRHLHTYQLM